MPLAPPQAVCSCRSAAKHSARAGITGPKQDGSAVPLSSYGWSSFPHYGQSPSKRPPWLLVEEVLIAHQWKDSPKGRRAYEEYLEGEALKLKGTAAPKDETGLWKKIRRGWYLGTEGFRDRLTEMASSSMKTVRRESVSGGLVEASEEERAEALISRMMKALELSESDLPVLRKSDPQKQAIAWRVRTVSTVSNRWISDRLQMGAPSAVSNAAAIFRTPPSRKAKQLRKRVEIFEF